MSSSFGPEFDAVFRAQFPRVFRYLAHLSGDAELARDLAQDAFLRLLRRGSLPERTDGWLIVVATNLWKNAHTTARRRARITRISVAPAAPVSAAPEDPTEVAAVRATLARLTERDRQLLSLLAEGYRYRDMAEALGLHEASIGTLLARAKQAFRALYEEDGNAP